MEVYKSETREVIKRFLSHRLSFQDCMGALDAALADLTPRLTGDEIAELRALMLKNQRTGDEGNGAARAAAFLIRRA